MCTTIYVLSKNMKLVEKIKLKIVIFTAVKKNLYIAWACFRNVYCVGNDMTVSIINLLINS